MITLDRREKYVDIGKGLAILAVVCGHISTTCFPDYAFGFWPVAFFFVVAGFYIKEANILKPLHFAGHKLKTLYLPGTVIYLLAVLLHNPFCKWGMYPAGEVHPYTHQAFALWDLKTYLLNIVKTVFAPNGELAMGAMWFLYALFFSLCFLSILAFCANRLSRRPLASNYWFHAFVFIVSSVTLVLSKYGVKLPRISNALFIMPFILGGYLLKQRIRLKFDNWAVFAIAAVIYVQCLLLPHPRMSFPLLAFPDVVLPLIMSASAAYVVLFLSKFLEKVRFLSGALGFIGRNSLYIMALHICGFFLCTKVIDLLDLHGGLAMSPSLFTYEVGGRFGLFLLYLLFGAAFPLLCITAYRAAVKLITSSAGKWKGKTSK